MRTTPNEITFKVDRLLAGYDILPRWEMGFRIYYVLGVVILAGNGVTAVVYYPHRKWNRYDWKN